MAIFNSDFEAIIFISLIAIALLIVNNLISFFLGKVQKFPPKYKIITNFVFRIIIVLVVVFLIIEGVPSFGEIDPAYQAILTGSISTAIAFASSGIFANLVSGIILLIIRPFEEGDLVKIEGDKGIVRSITLSRVIIETFDYILIEKANSKVISAPIVNYTLKLSKIKSFNDFKKAVQSPLEKGLFDPSLNDSNSIKNYEAELQETYQRFFSKKKNSLYSYTFRMTFPYKHFRIMMHEVDQLCINYKNDRMFSMKPEFHIVDIGFKISVKFKILAFNSEKIFDYQSNFSHDILKIINKHKVE